MATARQLLLCLLLATVSVPAWVGASALCVHDAMTAVAQPHTNTAHAGHLAGDAVLAQPVDRLAHQHAATADPESWSATCPCCDSCVVACAASGCSAIVIAFAPYELPVEFNEPRLAQADVLHAGPTPHSLFRPPISIL
jgi:hypothetical protein